MQPDRSLRRPPGSDPRLPAVPRHCDLPPAAGPAQQRAHIARARSDAGTDGLTDKLPDWSAQAAFGEDAVIAGFNANVAPAIDHALKMAGLPVKKVQISTPNSLEPALVNRQSPVKPFAGY